MKISRLQRDLLTQFLLELEKARVSPDRLLSESRSRGLKTSGFTPELFAGPDALLLLEVATDLTGDPGLALRLGQHIGIESYGTFGFALLSCANLRDSIELLVRHGKAFFRPDWTAHNHDDDLVLRINATPQGQTQQQLLAELCFSQLERVSRSLYRGEVMGAVVHLDYPPPPHAALYQRILSIPVRFGQEHSQLFLPATALDTPVKTANLSTHVLFYQQCEEMLQGMNRVQKTTAAVRVLLMQSAGEFLDISQVAQQLNISERTLRRRLEVESTSFRATFEDVRNLLATEYLVKTTLTVADIAHLLDYTETVNFRRAFVRRNGVTPRQYRQKNVRRV